MKQIKIFIGVVPDQIMQDGSFNMLVVDRANETVKTYPVNMGDNAKVITVNENDMILFEHVGDTRIIQEHSNVLELVSNNLQKVVDNDKQNDDNKT